MKITRTALFSGGSIVLAIMLSLMINSSNADAGYTSTKYNDPVYLGFIETGFERTEAELLTIFSKTYELVNGHAPDKDSLVFMAKNIDLQYPFLKDKTSKQKLAFMTLTYEYGSSLQQEIPGLLENLEQGNSVLARESFRTSNYCKQNYGNCTAIDTALFSE